MEDNGDGDDRQGTIETFIHEIFDRKYLDVILVN